MRIAVIDYPNSQVDIIDEVPEMESSEQVKNYLSDVLQYNTEEISFIFGKAGGADKIDINFLTPKDYGE